MTAAHRRAQLDAFYRRHADRLRRRVASRVSAPDATIEDACQNAWAILLRSDHVTLDERGAHWLAKVAIREGWRLASTARDVPVGVAGDALEPHGSALDPRATAPAADELSFDRIVHEQRVADLTTLKPRERRELYLKALGYRYDEIAEVTGSTLTAVNRRLSEGRAQLRRRAHDRDNRDT
jgi:DNA-directed RNA polymerase specialized sigma24 family protein